MHISLHMCRDAKSLPSENELRLAIGHSEAGLVIEGNAVWCQKSGVTINWWYLILLDRFKIALKAIPENVLVKTEYFKASK